MSVWFEGSARIDCSLDHVKRSFEDPGALYVGVVESMPGLSSVELLEQGDDFVTIRTNEGVMKRTNISIRIDAQRLIVELDETYQAGSRVTTTTHFLDEFTSSGTGVEHRTIISDVEAPGILGFFYRKFGNSSTGNAFLKSYKSHLESGGEE
jgi:hypothetical protein